MVKFTNTIRVKCSKHNTTEDVRNRNATTFYGNTHVRIMHPISILHYLYYKIHVCGICQVDIIIHWKILKFSKQFSVKIKRLFSSALLIILHIIMNTKDNRIMLGAKIYSDETVRRITRREKIVVRGQTTITFSPTFER